MTKAIVKTQPLNKASSEIREICNPGILAGIPGRDGHLPGKASPSPRHQAPEGRATSRGRAGPTQGTDSHLVLGTVPLVKHY